MHAPVVPAMPGAGISQVAPLGPALLAFPLKRLLQSPGRAASLGRYPLSFLQSTAARVLFLLLLSSVTIFFELGRMDVTTENEGQRTAPPKHMLRTGDFVVPELNGRPYLAKPPLLYWATAGVYAATGVQNELTGRLVTATAGVILVLAVYLILRRKAGEEVGFFTALAVACAPYCIERSRFAELDQPLLLFTFLTICALHTSWTSCGLRKWGMTLLAGVLLAAATMLKGPVPYLFVGAAYVAFVLTRDTAIDDRASSAFRAMGWTILLAILLYPLPIPFPLALGVLVVWWLALLWRTGWGINIAALPQTLLAIVLAIGLCAPWAWAVLQRLGWENIQKLVNSEVVDRTYTATEINSGFPLFYIIALPVMLAPFGLLLPVQLSTRAWRDGAPFYRFSLAMAWYSIGLFSLIAGKEYEYIMPCAPFLLCALAYAVVDYTRGALDAGPSLWFGRWVVAFRWLTPLLAVGVAVAGARHPVLLVETIVLAIAVIAINLLRLTDKRALVLRVAVSAALVITGGLLTRAYRQTGERSPKEMALACKALVEKGVAIEATKVYAAFNNYSELPIPIQLDAAVVEQRLNGSEPYFYITTMKILESFPHHEAYADKIVMGPLKTHELVLLGNRPPTCNLTVPAPEAVSLP
jgi:4-amino-4-deoxy-L-arabinose transferase-like glycosyltransferase